MSKNVTSLERARIKKKTSFLLTAEAARCHMLIAAEDIRRLLEKHGLKEVRIEADCDEGSIFVVLSERGGESVRCTQPEDSQR